MSSADPPAGGAHPPDSDVAAHGAATHDTTPRWLRRAFLPVSALLLILAGALAPLPAYLEMPGTAAGIPSCVMIGERPDATVNGDYLFTTVAQRDATPFGLIVAGVRDDQRVVSKGDLLGGTRRDRYLQRQRQVFIDATDRAVVVALRAAGLPVDVRGTGVDVIDVIADTPADGVLRAGDVITAVDGAPVRADRELIDAVDGTTPLELRLERDGDKVVEELTPVLRDVDGGQRPMIGVRIATHAPRVRLPLRVDVASGRVGGPSAGLMTALAVYDLVNDDDTARGRRIAGTGTLGIDGTVGRISGIDLKVRAAERAGADVFVSPASQADDARDGVPDGSDLVVVGVDTFADARTALVRPAGPDAAVAPTRPGRCRFTPDA